MRDRERPGARAYEQELARSVGTGTDRWLTELRLAVLGIIVSVGLSAADIGLTAGGWAVALTAGLGSALVFLLVLWWLRPRG